ncbi:MAG: bifunctional diguanylate cyclase/phosphodiesterase [Lachnospiraceae bacterium]|nr:bifunctional diguanylate cyclase/phosphodiesterase [Lachnospiraceae bacterium]
MKNTGVENHTKLVLEETLDRLYSKKSEASSWVFVLLVIIYLAATCIVSVSAASAAGISINNRTIPVYTFAGVFTSLANMCVLIITMYFGKKGFATSLTFLLVQIPLIIVNIIVNHVFTSIPGIFSNVLTIVAVCIIYFSNKKIALVQKELRNQAVTDILTGLPNWYAVTELINALIARKIPFANVTINLNGFKNINDTMGFDGGNQVLKEVARRWKKIADTGASGTLDFITRLSSDEFCLIIRRYKSEEDVYKTVKMYADAMKESFSVFGCDFKMSASFGYSIYPDDAETIDQLVIASNCAMKNIKQESSSNHILRYTPDILEDNTFELEGKIRTAIENDTVFYMLQPQFDMDHKLRGFEALARMKDENGNFISPGEFIPIAEKCGLIDKLDGIVFRKAASYVGNLIADTGAEIILSLNVSVRHLMMTGFTEEIRSLLTDSKIPPSQLEIEVTESIMIESMEKAKHSVEEIRNMGVQIAIDDFGTGYSSLSYINSMPATLLKIDKSFIDDINKDDKSKAYVQTIISLGHIMGLDVISEGVEDESQLTTLKEIGCDLVQGYVWGRPLPPEEAQKVVMDSLK